MVKMIPHVCVFYIVCASFAQEGVDTTSDPAGAAFPLIYEVDYARVYRRK